MAKKRKKRRSLPAAIAEALLSAVDWLCEGIAGAAVALLGGAARALLWLVRGAGRLLARLLRAILSVPVRIIRRLTAGGNAAARCLRLDGPEFEAYVALVLEDNGFKNIELTKGSGDQGADILAERGGISYAIQCKNYAGSVGNFAVQEAYAAAQFYGCERAAVICPREFTRGAKELAEGTGVELWDGKRLSHMMKISGRRPHHKP